MLSLYLKGYAVCTVSGDVFAAPVIEQNAASCGRRSQRFGPVLQVGRSGVRLRWWLAAARVHDVRPGVRPCDQVSVGEFNVDCWWLLLCIWCVSAQSVCAAIAVPDECRVQYAVAVCCQAQAVYISEQFGSVASVVCSVCCWKVGVMLGSVRMRSFRCTRNAKCECYNRSISCQRHYWRYFMSSVAGKSCYCHPHLPARSRATYRRVCESPAGALTTSHVTDAQ